MIKFFFDDMVDLLFLFLLELSVLLDLLIRIKWHFRFSCIFDLDWFIYVQNFNQYRQYFGIWIDLSFTQEVFHNVKDRLIDGIYLIDL